MSDLCHEWLAHLCETLNLPGVMDGYATLAVEASGKVHSFVEILEGMLRSERDSRRVRSSPVAGAACWVSGGENF